MREISNNQMVTFAILTMGENISCLVYWSITRMKGEMSKISEDQREVHQRICHFWNIIFQTFPYFLFPLFLKSEKKEKDTFNTFLSDLAYSSFQTWWLPTKVQRYKSFFLGFQFKYNKTTIADGGSTEL